ncbi:glycoside hydrolase domain-containing protein [Streptomyces sedi]|uniref:DUF1906 domain-containing protein n=1 Tax=Streptomyces sedi TaxID=555059 RepID=A0A5C4USW3_9ACTN|nr:glycoside hydrolase domain-containing protein [Streptomyces sedi]TNM26346.1 DUF1906 domain-containing protein [Streptomyces sedi]
MHLPAPVSTRRRRAAVLAALGGLVATGLGVAPTAAQAGESGDSATSVTYHGLSVEVPDDWRVVDLAEDPSACVRFDVPTLYLGSPAGQRDCPAGLVGRDVGIVLEPLAEVAPERLDARTAVAEGAPAAAAARATSHDGTLQLAVEQAGLLVTAAHTPATEGEARAVLEGAEITDAARPAATPAPAETAARPTAVGPQPGDYTGLGFDACAAPSQAAMDAWGADSPFQAVGVYISGASRACDQPNLTAAWVEAQTAAGWHLTPIDVGRQAPCTSYAQRISEDPATARAEGAQAADESIAAAAALGIPAGSVLYSDIEAYTPGATCTAAVLSYLSGWTEGLHAQGYLSGVYSSGASGIQDVAAAYDDPNHTRVDHIWFAWWNGQADTDAGSYAPAEYWADRQRIHQYVGEVTETHGGVSINIDRNYLDVAP